MSTQNGAQMVLECRKTVKNAKFCGALPLDPIFSLLDSSLVTVFCLIFVSQSQANENNYARNFFTSHYIIFQL